MLTSRPLAVLALMATALVPALACSSTGNSPAAPDLAPPDAAPFNPGDGGALDDGAGGSGGSYGGDAAPECSPPCAGWQQCSQGACAPAPGRCEDASQCGPLQECNTADHQCVDLPDPCEGVTCSGKGVCSRDSANNAVCNCESGYKPDGTSCVVDADAVTWCSVWSPKSFVAHVGDAATMVYGRIYHAGVTTNPSEQAQVKAQLGYTTHVVSYPVVASDLSWVDAAFNLAGQGDYGNDHEYMAGFPSTAAGQYSYVYRFSINGGASWTMCDTAGVIAGTPVAGSATISGADPTSPVLQLVAQPSIGADGYSFQVRFLPGQGGAEYDPAASHVLLNGSDTSVQYDPTTRMFSVQAQGVAPNKYAFLFRVKDTAGKPASLFVPLWVEPAPFSWSDALLYQILTDRFVDGDASNDFPVGPPVDLAGDWQGGDFRGIIQKLDGGYFDALGVNALWISSPVTNPDGHEPGKNANTGHEFAAYHAYWPIATGWTDDNHLSGIASPIDHHFGTEAELKELVNKAHAKGIRVLVDFVPNHVHDSAPLWSLHANDPDWWNLPYDDCSVNNGWDTRRTTCWFDPFLPDLKSSSAVVRKTLVDHAVWLIQEFNLDGFRVDATKHVETDILVDLRDRIQQEVAATGPWFYMVGETLGGDESLIKECIGANKLDGSVNDPFHWAVRDTFLNRSQSATSLDAFVQHDRSVWTSHYQGALMGNFFGSHDTERAVSIANGDAYNDRWTNPPPVPTDPNAFKKLRLAQTFLLTYRPIPIILMGDEFGMPGAADPDNRRMMKFGNELSSLQQQTLQHFGAIGKARAAHPALRRGSFITLAAENEFYAFARVDGTDGAIVMINLSQSPISRNVDVSAAGVSGSLTDAVGGATVAVSSGHLQASLDALTSAVFVK